MVMRMSICPFLHTMSASGKLHEVQPVLHYLQLVTSHAGTISYYQTFTQNKRTSIETHNFMKEKTKRTVKTRQSAIEQTRI